MLLPCILSNCLDHVKQTDGWMDGWNHPSMHCTLQALTPGKHFTVQLGHQGRHNADRHWDKTPVEILTDTFTITSNKQSSNNRGSSSRDRVTNTHSMRLPLPIQLSQLHISFFPCYFSFNSRLTHVSCELTEEYCNMDWPTVPLFLDALDGTFQCIKTSRHNINVQLQGISALTGRAL